MVGKHWLPRRGVLREILTGLPGRHLHTELSEPELLSRDEFHEISTGENHPQSLGSWGHRIIGGVFWVSWFSWGVYNWWFVDRTPADFIIASVLWTLTFAFTFVGVPLVRRLMRPRP